VAYYRPAPGVELTTGSLLSPSRKLPDFSRIDQQGRVFGEPNLRGHWSLLFFGYTNCPYFCPTTLTTLAAMQARLRAEHAAVLPQVIFVSVDAKRDTPAQLARFCRISTMGHRRHQPSTAASRPSHVNRGGRTSIGRRRQLRRRSHQHHLVLNPAARLTAILTGPFSADALRTDFQHIVAAPGALAGRT
jgi:hypothetical protein